MAEALLCEAPVAPYPVEELKRKLEHAKPGKVLRILATAPIPPREKAVLLALWCHSLWGMGETHPSLREEDVIDEAGVSRATFYRARDQLEAWGLVEWQPAEDDRRRTSYSFPWRSPANASQSETQHCTSKAVTSLRLLEESPPPSPGPATTPPPHEEETPSSPARERREGDSRFAQDGGRPRRGSGEPQARTALPARPPALPGTAATSVPRWRDAPGNDAATAALTDDQAQAVRRLEALTTTNVRLGPITAACARRLVAQEGAAFSHRVCDLVARFQPADEVAYAKALFGDRAPGIREQLTAEARDRKRVADDLAAMRDLGKRMEREANERARRDLAEFGCTDALAACRARSR